MDGFGLRLLTAAMLFIPLPTLAKPQAGSGAVPALYPTKAEAEKAARLHFNCTGAHRMGTQWMPCPQHSDTHSAPGHSH
jgi:hypothetical protein